MPTRTAPWIETVDLTALRQVAGGLAETSGQALAGRFCAAVVDAMLAGKAPKIPDHDLRDLARALLPLAMPGSRTTRKALTVFGRRLGIKRRQGRRPLSEIEAAPLVEAVLRVLTREQELVDGYLPERAAHAQAIREVAAAEGVTTRAVQGWCSRYGIAFANRIRPDDATCASARDHAATTPKTRRAA